MKVKRVALILALCTTTLFPMAHSARSFEEIPMSPELEEKLYNHLPYALHHFEEFRQNRKNEQKFQSCMKEQEEYKMDLKGFCIDEVYGLDV